MQFFVLLPIALGVFFGAAGIGNFSFVSIGYHIAYMTLFTLLAWACYGIGSALTSIVLRPWKPALLVVLTVGFFVGGSGLWWPLRDLLNLGFEPFLAQGSAFGSFWPPPPGKEVWYVVITLQGLAGWLLANWLDFRFRGVGRFGFAPPESAARIRDAAAPPAEPVTATTAVQNDGPTSSAVSPRLLQRLPNELTGAHVYALEAEEHYTKIHTDKGCSLVLLRFADAIAEMDPQSGLQVHRSYWVSSADVDHVGRKGRKMVVVMPNGLTIPVSRSYRVAVNSAGLPDGPGS